MDPAVTMISRRRGFTLIELMIVVVVVAILAAVAYPSYLAQIRKGRRSDAIQGLTQVLQAQERWRSVNVSYAPNAQLNTAWPGGLGIPTRTAGGYYDLAIGTNPVPTTSQNSDKAGAVACNVLTVTVSNGVATNTPTECWSR